MMKVHNCHPVMVCFAVQVTSGKKSQYSVAICPPSRPLSNQGIFHPRWKVLVLINWSSFQDCCSNGRSTWPVIERKLNCVGDLYTGDLYSAMFNQLSNWRNATHAAHGYRPTVSRQYFEVNATTITWWVSISRTKPCPLSTLVCPLPAILCLGFFVLTLSFKYLPRRTSRCAFK